jgi:peptidoglycan/LPS O-acetylase OafA/YrhL
MMHGFLLGDRPDIADARQVAVTFAALPVAVFIGWVFTRIVEEPITAYGRSWRWSAEKREEKLPELAGV